MKNCIVTMILLILFVTSKAQNIYYDALELKALTDSNGIFLTDSVNEESVYKILRSYLPQSLNNKVDLQKGKINSEFKNNDFINFRLDKNLDNSSIAGIGSVLSSIGSLDVTAFADALAQFLVQRTKEELNEAFFRKFTDFLKYYPEFKTLFPNTNVLVESFNSWEYASFLNTLREAFDKDIKELLSNLIKLKDLNDTLCPKPTGSSWKKKLCEDCRARIKAMNTFLTTNQGILLLSSIEIGNGLLSGQKIPDIIDSVSKPQFLLSYQGNSANETANIHNGIHLVNILSSSFKSNLTGRHYISSNEFSQLLKDSTLQNLYLGLLLQKVANDKIQFMRNGTAIEVAKFITPTNKSNLIAYISNFSLQNKSIEEAVDKLTKDKADSKNDLSADYGALFQASQQALRAVTNVEIISPSLQLPPTITEILNNTSKVIQIAHDISVRNYNAVVIGTLTMLVDGINNSKSVDSATKARLKEFSGAFLKYGSFAANVVLSKDPDEIKEAINSFALPAGSSSIKKHTQFNISVNAYTGFVYGIKNKPLQSSFTTKNINGGDSTVKLNGGQSLAVYAPVGVGFNWGLGWKRQNPWSISAFVSLIDVGAIVGYRFVTDTGQVSNTFKVSLSNIFAPGVNAIIGLPNMPLSVGVGAQWIPTLQRDPSSNDFYNLDYSGIRYQVFVAVDLPLLNLHTSKRNLLNVK